MFEKKKGRGNDSCPSDPVELLLKEMRYGEDVVRITSPSVSENILHEDLHGFRI